MTFHSQQNVMTEKQATYCEANPDTRLKYHICTFGCPLPQQESRLVSPKGTIIQLTA